MIIAAVILLRGAKQETLGYLNVTKTISLEDVLSGNLGSKSFNASWISGL